MSVAGWFACLEATRVEVTTSGFPANERSPASCISLRAAVSLLLVRGASEQPIVACLRSSETNRERVMRLERWQRRLTLAVDGL